MTGDGAARRGGAGRDGGVPARRAVVRWAWRMFRREWRQQVLVISLITVAVTIAVGGVTAAYNSAQSQVADFGTADHRLVTEVEDPEAVDAYLQAAEDWFGTIDVITSSPASVRGSADGFEVRAQDPQGPYGDPMVDLREGHYPTQAGELAVTEGIASAFGVAIGDSLELEDGSTWEVVGQVENPHDLEDDFGLVAPSSGSEPTIVTVLAAGDADRVTSFAAEHDPGPGYFEARDSTVEGNAAGAGALAASTVVLLLVCLVAAAGFVVIAQRRMRQLGMLTALGATPKHLRLVVMANAAIVGAVAAVVGTLLGLVLWFAFAPRLEGVVQHRIDRFEIPWLLVGSGTVLAVVASMAAGWWPARSVSRVPVVRALSGRPPRPRRARRSLVLAALLVLAGVACLVVGIDAAAETEEEEFNDLLVIAGALAIPLGIALVGPLAVRSLGPLAKRLPVAARLALRDLARYQARAGAALAAVSLGLGLAAAVVIAAAAAEYDGDEGNLSDSQLMIRASAADEGAGGVLETVPDQSPGELERLEAEVERVTADFDDATIFGLDMPLDPEAGFTTARSGESETMEPPVALAQQIDEDLFRDRGALYVATPQLLEHFGMDPQSIPANTEVLTVYKGDLLYHQVSEDHTACEPEDSEARCRVFVENVETIEVPYSSSPQALITPEAVDRLGWQSARAAWLVETKQPLSSEQVAEAREIAADVGLFVEARRGQEGLTQLRSGATVVGVLLGLGILAMTVGLIRSETASDVRMLAATGATSRVRRTVTGVTAGALALLGALLGTAGAYVGLGAGYSDDLAQLSPLPIVHLLVILVGLPAVAGVAGWLLGGREPPAMAREASL